MKKTTKRTLAVLLAGTMAVSMAACGSGEPVKETTAAVAQTEKNQETAETAAAEELYHNTEGFPIVKEPITIEMAGIGGVTKDWQSTHVIKKIEEEMGIKINCTTYEGSIVATQFATQITTDTLPDIMGNYNAISKATANQYGAEGYLLDLADYLHVMPNFAKFLEENPEFAAFNTTEDGSIYSFDRIRAEAEPKYELYVSKENQEKYGFSVDEIKTVDDFYNVLKSIKEQNPDVIPWGWASSGFGQRGVNVIRTAFGMDTSLVFENAKGVDADGNVILYDITDNSKEYYKYMNKLWEEGLVDQEAFIMTLEEYYSKIRKGDYVFWFEWSDLVTGVQAADGSVYQDYDSLVALTSDVNPVSTYIMCDPYITNARVMVSAKTKYPEAVCRLLDYMFTEEGFYFFNYGTEGETYDLVETEIGTMAVNSDKYWDQANYANINDWRRQEVMINNVFQIVLDKTVLQAVHNASDEELVDYMTKDSSYSYAHHAHLEQAIRAQAEDVRYGSFLPVALTDDENKEIGQLQTDMATLISRYNAQFIVGDLDVDTEWDSYVKEIGSFWNKIQPVIQGAHDRMSK